MADVRHNGRIGTDPRTVPNYYRFFRRIPLMLDRNIQTIKIMVPLTCKQDHVLTDQDMILDQCIVNVCADADPNVASEFRSWIIYNHTVVQDDVASNFRKDP